MKRTVGSRAASALRSSWATELDYAFLPHQFANEDNCEAHETMTGPEIWWQARRPRPSPGRDRGRRGNRRHHHGGGPASLRQQKPDVRVHPLEPSNSPTMSTGHQVGHHRIQGISDEFIPPIVHFEELDEIVDVDDGDAIIMAQRLAADLGLGVGISSGANFLGAVKVQRELGLDAVVVTLFPDSNKKYLSTDLLHDEPEDPGHLSPRIGLHGFTSFNRVCRTCFETWEIQ